MKFEINRLAMLEAAKNAARVAPVNVPMDELKGILVESNEDTGEVFLTATSFEVSIQQKVTASIEESGAMLVDARLLVDMLRLLPGDIVAFSADRDGSIIKLASERSKFAVRCLPVKHYPKPVMPFPEETVKLSGICSLAKRTVFVTSKDDSKPALQCVCVKLKNNAVHAAACDGARLMLVKDSAGSPDEREFLLPGKSLRMLAAISTDADVYEVGDIGKEIVFVRGDMMFSIRKLLGEFIDTTKILQGIKPVYTATANAHQLKEALDILAVGAGSEPMNLVLSADQVTLRREGSYSEGDATVPAAISTNTPNTGFYYNINSLVNLFHVVEGKVRLELNEKGMMFIKTRNEVYLQVPTRAPVVEVKKTNTRGTVQEAA